MAGTLKIPFPNGDGRKPGWIVDGQQRALALARSRRQDFPVPVNAFIADSVECSATNSCGSITPGRCRVGW